MKLNYYMSALIGIFFLINVDSYAQHTQQARRDSLPEGFTEKKVKSLKEMKR